MEIAHIRDMENGKENQSVKSHLEGTAQYAAETLEYTDLQNTGRLIGLMHDFGKNCVAFSDYIIKSANGESVRKGSVNHTFAGCIWLLEKYHCGKEPMTDFAIEIIVWAIGSHHGLFDCASPDNIDVNGFDHRLEYDKKSIYYDETVDKFFSECVSEQEINELVKKSVSEINILFSKIRTNCLKGKYTNNKGKKDEALYFMMGLTARLVLSALINGDRRDTAEFMHGNKFNFIMADKNLWQSELDNFNKILVGMPCDSDINRIRRSISDEACLFAEKNSNGIYRINVPTGAGKTLTTLRFALAHGASHGMSRVIFVVPLLAILDQNLKVIKKNILHKEIVTEHHSNIVKSKMTKDELDQYELLAETWDSPVIITTLVQLLNTLFDGKTSSVRRMNSLMGSTIIIDEVQTVPKKMTFIFNMAMNYLADFCGCTIVLCSATQPCFEQVAYPLSLNEIHDIIKPNDRITDAFKRVDIIDKTNDNMTIDGLADFSCRLIENSSSLLVICNTKQSALQLFKCLDQLIDDSVKVFHLSTSMCMQHRNDTLDEIGKYLSDRSKIICVSTQLVEAGVDFSFESLIRVRAGLDNISQAAGRCNRSFDYKHICSVYIVRLENENLAHLNDIRDSQSCTAEFLLKYNSAPDMFGNYLLSDRSVQKYYSILYHNYIKESTMSYETKCGSLLALLSSNMNCRIPKNSKYILLQSFKTAGDLFEVFDTQTTDIIVPYNDKAREIICDLVSQKAKFDLGYLTKKISEAKPYTISVFSHNLHKLSDMGMLMYDDDRHFIALNDSCYNERTGLDINNDIIF